VWHAGPSFQAEVERAVALKIDCPHCGPRPFTEFDYGGELVLPEDPAATLGAEEDLRRVFVRANVAGVQRERWFHAAGCRRWLTLERDTVRNRVVGAP
jgi:sarcosine oxidase subunit delta